MTDQITKPVMTVQLATASLNLELAKDNYQQLLQGLEDMEVSRDTVVGVQDKIKEVRKVIKKIEEAKAEKKKPAFEECKAWDAAYNGIVKPIETILAEKSKKIADVAAQIAKEEADKQREAERVKGIRDAIQSFFLNATSVISSATTPQDIVNIEKAIGSHKANKAKYGEFLPELIEIADKLSPLIKARKEAIKTLLEAKQQEEEARQSGNDQAAIDAIEKKELAEMQMTEASHILQTEAYNLSSGVSVEVQEIKTSAPKPKRTTYEWEVMDINLLFKKFPHLVTLTPNKEKLDELLATKKAEGAFDKTDSIDYFGVKLFIKKSY